MDRSFQSPGPVSVIEAGGATTAPSLADEPRASPSPEGDRPDPEAATKAAPWAPRVPEPFGGTQTAVPREASFPAGPDVPRRPRAPPPEHPAGRAAVLEQSTRQQIYEHIRSHEGHTYSEVKRTLSLSNGSLTYHLQVLERAGLVSTRCEGGRKLLYSPDSRLPPSVRSGDRPWIQQRMLLALAERPGTSVADMARSLGVSRQLATHHVRMLAQEGILSLERRGNRLCAIPVEDSETRG